MKEHPGEASKKGIPGPGSYKISGMTGSEGKKFSMRPKTRDPVMKHTYRDAPGPGAYDFKASVNQTGRNFNSKMRSSSVCTIQKTKGGRFGSTNNPSKMVPGPGQYQPKLDMTKTGDYFVSKFRSAGTRTFYHSDRRTIGLPECAKVTPGPGSYRAPSEFGFYENKRKFVKKAKTPRGGA